MNRTGYNIRIAYQFPSDNVPFLSITSEAGNMYASYLQKTHGTWRSTSTDEQVFEVDLDGLRIIRVFCLYNHNLYFSSKIKIELFTDEAFTNLVYTITKDGITPLYGIGMGMLGITPLGGYSTEVGQRLPSSVIWMPKKIAAYARITITDTNNPDGYIQASRMILGDYWEPTFNFEPGYSSGPVTNSKQITLQNGSTYANRLTQQRDTTVALKNLLPEEELIIYEFLSKVDLNQHVLISTYPLEGSAIEQLHTILGNLTSWDKVTHDSLNIRSVSFNFREVI
jgi:hypothetical protein